MDWRRWIFFVLLFGIVGTGAASAAVDVDVPGTGLIWMRVRVAPEGMDLYDYRNLIQDRLSMALSPSLWEQEPVTGTAVHIVGAEEGTPAIYVGDILIVEVDAAHAQMHASTPEGLARVWAKNLAAAVDRWAHINRPLR